MKSRRGISSVVGMIFAIIAIVTTVGYVTFSLNVLDSYNQSVLARNQMSLDAGKEKIDLYSAKITANSRFNITIANSGNLPINITRIWVQNTTATDWVNYYVINKLVSPGALLTNIGVSSPVSYKSVNTYNLKLITGRGNSMQFSMGSPGAKPLFLQLQIIPNSIRTSGNATLLLVATNNLTSSNLLTNITPNTPQCSTTGGATFTLKTGPTPPQYSYLGNGGTTIFKWVYNAVGANNTRILCTASLQNGLASNTASDIALITTSATPGQNREDMANRGLTIRNPSSTFSTTIAGGAVTANRTLNTPVLTQTETIAVVPQTAQSSPANPTGTISTTGLMMGLSGSITPRVTGKIFVIVSGDITNSVSGDGSNVQIRTGTGTAPANAAALTGTTCGGLVKFVSASATNTVPFSEQCIVSGLTVGTTVWIDVGLAAVTGGTATIADVSVSAFEQ